MEFDSLRNIFIDSFRQSQGCLQVGYNSHRIIRNFTKGMGITVMFSKQVGKGKTAMCYAYIIDIYYIHIKYIIGHRAPEFLPCSFYHSFPLFLSKYNKNI